MGAQVDFGNRRYGGAMTVCHEVVQGQKLPRLGQLTPHIARGHYHEQPLATGAI